MRIANAKVTSKSIKRKNERYERKMRIAKAKVTSKRVYRTESYYKYNFDVI